LVEGVIRYAIRHNLITYSELLFSDGYIRCKLTGGQCSTVCPSFSSSCSYGEYIPRYYTIGQLYYLIQVGIDITKDDRMFIIKLLSSGELDDEDESDWRIADKLEDIEFEFINTTHKITGTSKQETTIHHNEIFKQKYPELYSYIETYIKQKTEELSKLKSLSPTHKKMLKQLSQITPTIFSFDEYVSILVRYYILNGELSERLVDDIVTYLLTDYQPKDLNDIPYVRWTEKDINRVSVSSSVRAFIPTNISKLYEDYRKWDSERIELAKSVERTKQIIVVNDIDWVWFNIVCKEKFKITNPDELTYQDILLRQFINSILYRVSYLLVTTHIIYENLNQEQLHRLSRIFQFISYLVENQYSELYTLYKLTDYLIPEQVTNQYKLIIDLGSNIESNEIRDKVKSIIMEEMLKVEELISEYKRQKKDTLPLAQMLSTLNKLYKRLVSGEPIKYSEVIDYITGKTGNVDIEEYIKGLEKAGFIEKCEIVR